MAPVRSTRLFEGLLQLGHSLSAVDTSVPVIVWNSSAMLQSGHDVSAVDTEYEEWVQLNDHFLQ